MARLGASKKKKSPRAADPRQIKKELKRVTEQLESCKRELAEATEQQMAAGEILRVIASSPTDVQPVLNVVAENAAKLCEATDSSEYCASTGRSFGSLLHTARLFRSLSRDP